MVSTKIDTEKKVVCPNAKYCQFFACTHREPHKRQSGNLSLGGHEDDFCRAAWGICPACVKVNPEEAVT